MPKPTNPDQIEIYIPCTKMSQAMPYVIMAILAHLAIFGLRRFLEHLQRHPPTEDDVKFYHYGLAYVGTLYALLLGFIYISIQNEVLSSLRIPAVTSDSETCKNYEFAATVAIAATFPLSAIAYNTFKAARAALSATEEAPPPAQVPLLSDGQDAYVVSSPRVEP